MHLVPLLIHNLDGFIHIMQGGLVVIIDYVPLVYVSSDSLQLRIRVCWEVGMKDYNACITMINCILRNVFSIQII